MTADPDDPTNDDGVPSGVAQPAAANSWLSVAKDFITADFLTDLAERSAGTGMNNIDALLAQVAAAPDPQQYWRDVMPSIAAAGGTIIKTLRSRERAAGRQRKAAARAAEAAQQTAMRGDKFPGMVKAMRQIERVIGSIPDDMPDAAVHAEIKRLWPNCAVTLAAVQRFRRRQRRQKNQ